MRRLEIGGMRKSPGSDERASILQGVKCQQRGKGRIALRRGHAGQGERGCRWGLRRDAVAGRGLFAESMGRACMRSARAHAEAIDRNTGEVNMPPVHFASQNNVGAAPATRVVEALADPLRPMAALMLAAVLLAAAGTSWAADELRSVKGLAMPESVVVGTDGRLYVSEIGGFGKDGDGRIVVIDAAGKTVKPFATGLDDPKGLVISRDVLFVADKTRVMKIDASGQVSVLADAKDFPQPPLFLNDLALDARGDLYVSDTGDTEQGSKGAIFRITPQGKVSLLISESQNALFKNPNGLLFEPSGSLLVVDFFSGDLLRLDTATKKTEKLAGGF
ncbi:MAG: SMP-30/gluconolactonase/LRE family protein, partial [Methylibium sp.]|nr:SMP-30/gluconolactonase/LRE family protein [Methylibium sp.]